MEAKGCLPNADVGQRVVKPAAPCVERLDSPRLLSSDAGDLFLVRGRCNGCCRSHNSCTAHLQDQACADSSNEARADLPSDDEEAAEVQRRLRESHPAGHSTARLASREDDEPAEDRVPFEPGQQDMAASSNTMLCPAGHEE